MSAQDQISRLEGLLDRIRRNAKLPRIAVAASVSEAVEEEEAIPISEDLLLDEEIVDITDESVAATPDADADAIDIDFDDEEDEPPASSRRPKVASSMDEALAGAAAMEEEREVPLKTPPPESGRQITTTPPMQQSAPPADLLEAELPLRPTTEQLGQTIDLEEPIGPALELDEPLEPEQVAVVQESAPEELDIALPGRPSGVYSEALTPPPEAREELERHRQREAERSAPAHEIPKPPLAPAVEDVAPQVVARPAIAASAQPSEFIAAAQSFSSNTFVELLDASLALGSD